MDDVQILGYTEFGVLVKLSNGEIVEVATDDYDEIPPQPFSIGQAIPLVKILLCKYLDKGGCKRIPDGKA